MSITTGTKIVLDSSGSNVTVKTINDSADSTTSPAHGIIDGSTGVLISSANPLAIRTASLITAAGATMTRVANTTAYASGQLIANSTTAASCTIANSGFTVAAARANDIPGRLSKCILQKSSNNTVLAIFRVHIFNVNPLASAPLNGDGGTFFPASRSGYMGRFDVTMNQGFNNDGAAGFGVPTEGAYIDFTPVTGTQNLYAILEARAGYTPISAEVFALTLITE